MSTLDEKLDEILKNGIDSYIHGNGASDEAVEQIKQAFVEEGWSRPLEDTAAGQAVLASIAADRRNYLTGPEWYEKFVKSMGKDATCCTGCSCGALHAARRASGIRE